MAMKVDSHVIFLLRDRYCFALPGAPEKTELHFRDCTADDV